MQYDIEKLAPIVVDCGYHLHRDVGPGLLVNFSSLAFRELIKRMSYHT